MGQKKMMAAEVRKLPVGAEVAVHGRDRRGNSTWVDCVVVQSGRTKVLKYLDFYGTGAGTVRIRDLPNKYFTVKEEGGAT